MSAPVQISGPYRRRRARPTAGQVLAFTYAAAAIAAVLRIFARGGT